MEDESARRRRNAAIAFQGRINESENVFLPCFNAYHDEIERLPNDTYWSKREIEFTQTEGS